MKKFFIAIAALCLSFASVSAQELQQLPLDPAVKVGKLDNGLTYYIRHNELPAQRAEFYLATNVGAIQEAPDQDGLAHFLEHMCFNGTKNFPGKDLLNWLESIGASFGGNVNAGTGVEQTQYMLNNIPLIRESVVDTCLLIMHDYSHFVTCDPVEIDNERGVILEERRSRRVASWRLHEQSLPYYYGDSKYGGCTLIGSEENLKTFKPESLVNFYKTWYRPDLQALIVVGDIDVDQVEAKIKTIFSDIPAPVDPRPKDYIKIPDNIEPMIGILTDPEQQNTALEILWKSEPQPEELNSTVQGAMIDIMKSIIGLVMAERFEDICAKPDAPFIGADLSIGKMCESMEVVMGSVSCKDGEAVKAFRAFLTEAERMKRYGFTDAEVERAKTTILSSLEAEANRASTRTNDELVPELINHFFDNYAFMDPSVQYQLASQILPQLTAQVLNSVTGELITKENFVLVYKAPAKEGLVHPTEEQFKAVIEEVAAAEIEAPAGEEVASDFLDPSTLKGSKVKKTATTIYGATQWTLKNGVTVILYPTENEKDRISYNLFREGGQSLIATEDIPSFESNIFSLFHQYSGLSQYPCTTLSKMMSGKNFNVSTDIQDFYNGLSGSSTVKDFESALQMMYLKYTDPRFDEAEYAQALQVIEAVLPNFVSQPDYQLQKALLNDAYDQNPRVTLISEEVLAAANLETLERVTRQLYNDAAGCTMVIVGDFDPQAIKPLIEKYIGSLPKGKKAPHINLENGASLSKKTVVDDFKFDMKTPKTTVAQIWRQDMPYSVQREIELSAVDYILNMVYTETLREEEGGTYGASASTMLERLPEEYGFLQVVFETNEAQSDKLRELSAAGLKNLAANGPTAEHFDKTVKYLTKLIPERRITNSYWKNAIENYVKYGEDTDAQIEAAVAGLTPESIKATAADLLNGNFIEIVMRPLNDVEAE